MQIPSLPTSLSDPTLTLRSSLPLKPTPVTLTGRTVRLAATVIDRDITTLYAISNGQPITIGERSIDSYDAEELVWRFMGGGPFESLEEFTSYMQRQVDAPNGTLFTVFDQASDHPVGVVMLMSNSPADLKIELGNIWYSPLTQRGLANGEATYLLLKHVFALGYRRAEWKCNALNERSRRAALRMGFQFEGIQESHMIVKNRSRDTAWYRILAHEWPSVQAHLEKLLVRT